ncbi:EAL domain-containing protein [Thauera aromatica]|uniref:EAL domain-containing protein n=1 Tax=Thauera aromatica TaxID=59405 RepID=UPI001FFDD811|nr:EAL domain-containing protein [Thauera aromatica]MCK2087146.1 EAL domain-containing protein [Thauera aromatica]
MPLRRWHIIAIVSVPVLLSLVLVLVVLRGLLDDWAYARWSEDHGSLAAALAAGVDRDIGFAVDQLRLAASAPEFGHLAERARIDPAINGLPEPLDEGKRRILEQLRAQGAFSVLFVLTPEGEHYLAHPFSVQRGLKQHSLADRPYFQQARNTGELVISDSFVGADGVPAVAFDLPVRDARGTIILHLGGVMHLERLSRFLARDRIDPFGMAVLVDRRGTPIAHSDPVRLAQGRLPALTAHPRFNVAAGWDATDLFLPFGGGVAHAADLERHAPVRFMRLVDAERTAWGAFDAELASGWRLFLFQHDQQVYDQIAAHVWSTAGLFAAVVVLTGLLGLAMALRFGRGWQQAEQALSEANLLLEQRVRQRAVALRDSEARYRTLFESTGEAILVIDSGTIVDCNPAAVRMFGAHDRDELVGVHPGQLSPELQANGESSLTAANRYIVQAFEGGKPSFEWTHRRVDDGRLFITDIRLSRTELDGRLLVQARLQDVTERKQAEARLELAASVFSHAREGITITDAEGGILDVNDAFTRITGYERDEVLGKNPRILQSGLHEPAFYAGMWRDLNENRFWEGEVWNRRKSGEVFPELLTISAVTRADGQLQHYVAVFSDISRQKESEARLEHLAYFDELTGLPNRSLLADRLDQAMAHARRTSARVVLAYIDLDGFKAVNDAYGHETGDRVLSEIATRLKACVREQDTVARLGGDEFAAVLTEQLPGESGHAVLQRLLGAIAEPVEIDHRMLRVSGSIGTTSYPQREEVDPDQLLRQADQAMYQAKLAGKNRYHAFDVDADDRQRIRHGHLDRIGEGLQRGEFVLYYQPKVNMRSGVVLGAEALIRWQHPEHGLLPPAAFLPHLVQHPLEVELGRWVIKAALTQIERWQAQGRLLAVSVNVAGHHLQQVDFIDELTALLAAHSGVPAGALELEVLESSALEDIEHVSRVIDECARLGVRFAIDDFGTGYSSLTYLKQLSAGTLKIDQSFVRDMLDDPDDLAILEGVMGLAGAFHREAVAEGVETEAHGRMLLQLGCELAQGYAIARPMPAEDVLPWVSRWRPAPTWVRTLRLPPEALPGLYACVEHRAWVARIEAYLAGADDTPPVLAAHQCRFGKWLDAQPGSGDWPRALEEIGALHGDIHTLGDTLVALHAGGRADEARAGLEQLHHLRDRLLAAVEALPVRTA